MRPIRFCMVTTFYPPASFGGDGVQVQRLARALAERGHDVTVVHSLDAYRTLARRPEEDALPDPGIKVIPIASGSGAAAPLASHVTGRPLLGRRALAKALKGPFDVIHFHNPSLVGGPSVIGMGQATLRLYTAHEQWLVCPMHVLWKNNREVCEKPSCFTCTLRHRRPPQLWRSSSLLGRAMTELDGLIVPSQSSERLHDRFAGTVRIEQIPHFVPEAPATPPLVNARPYFLFVGRHERIKGLDRLIEAFRRRRSEDLIVTGHGTMTEELRRKTADLPHVRFVGWQEGPALDALYRGALAVVVPTLGHESFGLVAVEAFARGTPAIVHAFGALAELAETGGGIGYRTPEELDVALERVAGSPGLQAELGRRAREAYLERWTPDAHMDAYFGLIEDLARRRGAADLARAATEGKAARERWGAAAVSA